MMRNSKEGCNSGLLYKERESNEGYVKIDHRVDGEDGDGNVLIKKIKATFLKKSNPYGVIDSNTNLTTNPTPKNNTIRLLSAYNSPSHLMKSKPFINDNTINTINSNSNRNMKKTHRKFNTTALIVPFNSNQTLNHLQHHHHNPKTYSFNASASTSHSVMLINNKPIIDSYRKNEINFLNDDLHLSNYNINGYISRTNTSHYLLKELINKKRSKGEAKSLPLAFISKHSINKSKKEDNPRLRINSASPKKKLHFRQLINHPPLKHNTPTHKALTYKFRCFSNPNNTNENREVPIDMEESTIFKIVSKLHFNHRMESTANRREIFTKLKSDIYKSDHHVKSILEDLKRTQILNDSDLKRKGFIIKTGIISPRKNTNAHANHNNHNK